jgi:hypothetical protein
MSFTKLRAIDRYDTITWLTNINAAFSIATHRGLVLSIAIELVEPVEPVGFLAIYFL